MIAVLQRVLNATLSISGENVATIGNGLVVLIGVTHEDSPSDIQWLVQKIINMRIFSDENGKMNLSVKVRKGELLIVSQFTLFAQTKDGNRPSFTKAARPEIAVPLYEEFIKKAELELGKPISTGRFGADMQINLTNDGPVTIIIDSKNRQ